MFTRNRRLRQNVATRDLVRETMLSANDFILSLKESEIIFISVPGAFNNTAFSFSKAIFPPPTISNFNSSSFKNIGNKLLPDAVLCTTPGSLIVSIVSSFFTLIINIF